MCPWKENLALEGCGEVDKFIYMMDPAFKRRGRDEQPLRWEEDERE